MIIVSGLSGSGKSIALQTLEDLHYYCVDNLPVKLLKPFANEILARENDPLPTTPAVSIDARNFPDNLGHFPHILKNLQTSGLTVELLFLEATDEALLKRYSETRRKHPLSREGTSLLEAIRQERCLLESFSAHADLIIDTSHTNVHELRDLLRKRLHHRPPDSLSILFESFGYKHSVPAEADFVFDVRCLPNPYWEPQLRLLSGLDDKVIAFLEQQPEVAAMSADLRQFLEAWVPRFEAADRSYLTIAIGCTGGQHRSVFIATTLANHFRKTRRNVLIRHRELA